LDKDGNSKGLDDIIDLKEFKEGMAPFRAKDKLFGFMDPTGEIVVPATFKSIGYFSNGLAWAKTTEGQVGFIDKQGKWVIEPKFLAANDFDLTKPATKYCPAKASSASRQSQMMMTITAVNSTK
jgi:hypothetical protein